LAIAWLVRKIFRNTIKKMANYEAKGRPRKKAADRLGQIIQFRMTAEERKRCEAAAEKAGGNLSQWIRDTLLEAAEKKG